MSEDIAMAERQHLDEDTLEAYCLGRSADPAAVRGHVAQCEECAARLEEMRRYVKAMQDALRVFFPGRGQKFMTA
jgi:anti-sigma factor RsiW